MSKSIYAVSVRCRNICSIRHDRVLSSQDADHISILINSARVLIYDEPGEVAELQIREKLAMLFRTGDWSRNPFIPPSITRFDIAITRNARLFA
jgi:hypothetical protein